MKRKRFYMALSLVIPGLGQLFLGWWVRGLLEMATVFVCAAGCAWEALAPIVLTVRNLLADGDIVQPDIFSLLVHVAVYIAIVIAVYFWSLFEIQRFCKDEEPSKEEGAASRQPPADKP